MTKIKAYSAGVTSATGKNDCTVRALANVLGWTYIKAHSIMSNVRVAAHGVRDIELYQIYPMANAKKVTAYGKNAIYRKRYLLSDSDIVFESVDMPIRVSHAVRTICKEGKHIILIRGHAFAVIDGKIYDQKDCSASEIVYDIFTFS